MIYHIVPRADWESLGQSDYRPESLDREGFIHCSSEAQVLATAKRYYAGFRDLLLLHIDPSQTQAKLVWENTVGGSEAFPHLYGSLEPTAVVTVERLIWTGEGFCREAFPSI